MIKKNNIPNDPRLTDSATIDPPRPANKGFNSEVKSVKGVYQLVAYSNNENGSILNIITRKLLIISKLI